MCAIIPYDFNVGGKVMDYNNGSYNNNQNQPNAPVPEPGRGKAVASLVLGIISVVFFWAGYFSVITAILAIIGLVLAVSGKKDMQASGNYSSRGMATAGLVLSIIGLVLSAISIVSCVICVSTLSSYPWFEFWDF